MSTPRVPRHLQAFFDQLAQAAGEVALERLRGLVADLDLSQLLRMPEAPAPAPAKRPRPADPLAEACAMLGVSQGATRAVVDAAYRVQAAACHPDRQPNEARKAAAAEAFRRLTDARGIIYQARGWK